MKILFVDAGAAAFLRRRRRPDRVDRSPRRFHQVGYLLSFKPNAAPSELFASVRRELSNVVAARWVRIFPPYCVGATANKDIRMHLRDAFQLPRHGPGRRMTPGLMRRMTPG